MSLEASLRLDFLLEKSSRQNNFLHYGLDNGNQAWSTNRGNCALGAPKFFTVELLYKGKAGSAQKVR